MGSLPEFVYHPDPVATGSVVADAEFECDSCGRYRGWRYVGPVYGEADEPALCPWCIADGSAADRFGVELTDVEGLVGRVLPDVVAEVATRTPGFVGWQQERWLVHCDDAAQYLGRAGADRLAAFPDALAMVAQDCDVATLSADGTQTAYLFRCRHCEAYVAYVDFA